MEMLRGRIETDGITVDAQTGAVSIAYTSAEGALPQSWPSTSKNFATVDDLADFITSQISYRIDEELLIALLLLPAYLADPTIGAAFAAAGSGRVGAVGIVEQ
jgi:hypothetical protein